MVGPNVEGFRRTFSRSNKLHPLRHPISSLLSSTNINTATGCPTSLQTQPARQQKLPTRLDNTNAQTFDSVHTSWGVSTSGEPLVPSSCCQKVALACVIWDRYRGGCCGVRAAPSSPSCSDLSTRFQTAERNECQNGVKSYNLCDGIQKQFTSDVWTFATLTIVDCATISSECLAEVSGTPTRIESRGGDTDF